MTSHPDLADVREQHDTYAPILDKLVSNALDDTANLRSLTVRAFELAACGHHLRQDGTTSRALRLGIEAGQALFAAAAEPHQPTTYTIAGQTVTRPGAVGPDEAHIGRWEMVFYGAIISRDAAAVRAICRVPKSLPLGSPTTGERYVERWFELLHGLGRSGVVDGELMERALEATHPDQLTEEARDEALYLRVPAIEALYHIELADGPALLAALENGLDKHRRYWTLTPENQRDPLGWVSWPLSALAEIARGRGLPVELDSDYLIRLPA